MASLPHSYLTLGGKEWRIKPARVVSAQTSWNVESLRLGGCCDRTAQELGIFTGTVQTQPPGTCWISFPLRWKSGPSCHSLVGVSRTTEDVGQLHDGFMTSSNRTHQSRRGGRWWVLMQPRGCVCKHLRLLKWCSGVLGGEEFESDGSLIRVCGPGIFY